MRKAGGGHSGWSDAPGEAVEQVFLMEAKIRLRAATIATAVRSASTTLDIASLDDGLRLACNEAFDLWRAAIVAGFVAHGAPAKEAGALAAFVLSAMEGAITVARAAKSPDALIFTGRFVHEAVDRAAETWDEAG